MILFSTELKQLRRVVSIARYMKNDDTETQARNAPALGLSTMRFQLNYNRTEKVVRILLVIRIAFQTVYLVDCVLSVHLTLFVLSTSRVCHAVL